MKRILAFILAFALIFPTTAVVACATTGEIVAVVNSEEVSDEVNDEIVSDENVSDENVSDENVSEEDSSGGSIFENVFNMDTIMDLIETIKAALGNIDFSSILDALSGAVDMIMGLLGLGGGDDTTPPEEPTTQPEEPTTQPEEPTTPPEEPTTEQTPSVDNSDNNSSNNNSGNTSNNNSSTNNNVQQSGGTPVELPLIPMNGWTILVIVALVLFVILIVVL